MSLPAHLIINADDFGFKTSINKAIVHCFENEIINSTSLMVNKPGFEEAVELAHSNNSIKNIGVHVNIATDAPVTNFKDRSFLTEEGNWDKQKTNKKFGFLSPEIQKYFLDEIVAQVEKVKKAKIKITHIDSHCHLHTLPPFNHLFVDVARRYQLKMRLAQSYNENNYVKFLVRKFYNDRIKRSGLNFSERFESVDYTTEHSFPGTIKTDTEVMLHPDYDSLGNLTDHLAATDMSKLLVWLKSSPVSEVYPSNKYIQYNFFN